MTTDRVHVYNDEGQEYRWRRVAANGEIIADSGEGYTRKRSAIRAAARANPDVPRERFMDATKRPVLRVRSVLLDGLPSEDDDA